MIPATNATIALKAANGQYVCAESGGNDVLVANRDAIGPWEQFTIIETSEPAQIRLRAGGSWVHTPANGPVRADKTPPNAERDFVMIPV
jgi:hypothetical protein